jgi:hypothetical protein
MFFWILSQNYSNATPFLMISLIVLRNRLTPALDGLIKSLPFLITEQGKTQDLSLKPTAKSAATLILKTSDKAQKTRATDGSGAAEGLKPYGPSLGTEKNMPVQEQMLTLLKQAVSGQLPLKESGPSSRPKQLLIPMISNQFLRSPKYFF